MKKLIIILLLVFFLLLGLNVRLQRTMYSEPTVTESPPYYTYVIQPHPVEDTVHMIIPITEVEE